MKTHWLKKINFYLLLILLVAGILRFYQLGNFPTVFYHDEAAKGYNAYSLLKTGMTFRGLKWPLYFTDFSETLPSTAIIYNYTVIPFVKLFGLNKISTRLPAAIFGTITVAVLYYLTKTLFRKQTIALLASFFLAVSPWHIYMSRYGIEPITFPFFFLIGWLALEKATGKRPFYLPFGMGLMAICLYTYRTALLFIPLFLISYFWINRKFFWERKRVFLLSLIVFFLASSPLLYLYLVNTTEMTNYYQIQSIFLLPNRQLVLFLAYFFGHYLLSFWLYLLPIVIISFFGFYCLFKESQSKRSIQMLLVSLLLVVIPPSLTLNWLVPAPTQSIGMTGFMEILAAYGLLKILPKINFSKAIFLLFLFCFSVVNGWILVKSVFPEFYYYFFVYDPGFEKLTLYVNSVETKYEKIFITNKANQPFIYFLFFKKYPPEKFLKEEVKRHYRGNLEFVEGFDKYTFCDINKCWQPNPNYLFVGRPDDFPDWPAKEYIEENGVKYFKVLEDAPRVK